MTIKWLTAFIDAPSSSFADTVEFWRKATGWTLSDYRGDGEQFVTLIPASGDSCLRLQRLGDGPARVHIDLHVAEPQAEAKRAVQLGAEIIADDTHVDDTHVDDSHVIMASPSGLPFCFVSHHGEQSVPPPIDPAAPHAVNQICIDIPAPLFDQECKFWDALTGWELRPSQLNEYASLAQPDPIPFRLLLQRLGADDPGTIARAHLDVSSGRNGADIADQHRAAGATQTGSGVQWVVMADPAGLPYCLTERDPELPTR